MKKILAIILCVLLVTALVGCGASRDKAAADSVDQNLYRAVPAEEYGGLSAGSLYAYSETSAPAPTEPVPGDSVSTNRKLIRTVSLNLETEEYDVLLDGISERIAACGGYVESLDADTRYSSDSRYAHMTIRVPAARLDEFVSSVSGISNVVQKSENTEDVTLTYVDLESHASALRTEQERLIELLAKAENLTEILEIEDRLTDVRYELEYMESQLRTYDNLVDYATVTLTINEVKVLTDTEVVEKGFWEKIGDGFMDSLNSVWEGLKNFFSFIVIAVPYLVVIAVIAGIILLIIILCVKKSRKKAAKRNTAPQKTEPPMPPRPVPQPPVAPQPAAPQQQPVNPEQK